MPNHCELINLALQYLLMKEKSEKKVPNPYGRKGGPAHQEKMKEVSDELRSKGFRVIWEFMVQLANGKRRFIDVVAFDRRNNLVSTHQVGKQTKKGIPIKRERDAAEDIETATGIKVSFHPYNILVVLIVIITSISLFL